MSKSENLNDHDFAKNLEFQESNVWRELLGGFKLPVKPAPSYLNPALADALQHDGYMIRYLPQLILGTTKDLKIGVDSFLTTLTRRYPRWRETATLTHEEEYGTDPYSITRLLEPRYWEDVKDGSADFPQLPGRWLAIQAEIPNDQIRKSPSGKYTNRETQYSSAKITNLSKECTILNLAPYLNNPTLSKLPQNTIGRLLEPLEWNLLANREGWGGQLEYTNTEYFSGSRAFYDEWTYIVGGGYPGTDQCKSTYNDRPRGKPIGYRVVISLNGKQ